MMKVRVIQDRLVERSFSGSDGGSMLDAGGEDRSKVVNGLMDRPDRVSEARWMKENGHCLMGEKEKKGRKGRLCSCPSQESMGDISGKVKAGGGGRFRGRRRVSNGQGRACR